MKAEKQTTYGVVFRRRASGPSASAHCGGRVKKSVSPCEPGFFGRETPDGKRSGSGASDSAGAPPI